MSDVITYPFTAIVGQEEMKLALLLNLINPLLGGVLIRGEKGTAKSTAVRGLVDLLDQVEVISGCPYHCRINEGHLCPECSQIKNPDAETYRRKVVELPINATDDRVIGSLNLERAIQKGEKSFEPGILADANGNILYVDEVNLLDDHIVDVLLDSAAMGINTVEREGISHTHPSRFVLVGTMNPEEGDIRPQLLDRFGLVVEVVGEQDPKLRSELIRRRLDFEASPEAFAQKWQSEQDAIALSIKKARETLENITIPDALYMDAAKIGIALKVDGHRADITLLKAAQTLAAFEGDKKVKREHLKKAAGLVLPHRMRKLPFDKASDILPDDIEALLA